MGTVYPCLPNANPDTDPIPWTCDFHPQPHPHWQYMNKLLELAKKDIDFLLQHDPNWAAVTRPFAEVSEAAHELIYCLDSPPLHYTPHPPTPFPTTGTPDQVNDAIAALKAGTNKGYRTILAW